MIVHKALPGVSQPALARFTERARRAARLRGQVNVLLASSREVRALNRQYRGKDKPTDVLSFPSLPALAEDFAGDIAIASDIAAANARRFGHDPQHEIKILILHAILHLAGFDHESDDGRMARKEERLRRDLGLAAGLIARTARNGHAIERSRAKFGNSAVRQFGNSSQRRRQ